MNPLHRGIRCIDFEHIVSITVVADIHRFGGYFWVRYNMKYQFLLLKYIDVDQEVHDAPNKRPVQSESE